MSFVLVQTIPRGFCPKCWVIYIDTLTLMSISSSSSSCDTESQLPSASRPVRRSHRRHRMRLRARNPLRTNPDAEPTARTCSLIVRCRFESAEGERGRGREGSAPMRTDGRGHAPARRRPKLVVPLSLSPSLAVGHDGYTAATTLRPGNLSKECMHCDICDKLKLVPLS